MNVLLRFGRFVLAHREKAVLVVMMLLCGVLALTVQLSKDDAESSDEDLRPEDVLEWPREPRAARDYPRAQLENDQNFEDLSLLLQQRRSVFRPSAGGGGAGELGDAGEEAWPVFSVRRVSQPTPGGAWIAQIEIEGKAYIAREGRSFANGQYELQRIDKTRLCVEVLRRLDDQVREFCQG